VLPPPCPRSYDFIHRKSNDSFETLFLTIRFPFDFDKQVHKWLWTLPRLLPSVGLGGGADLRSYPSMYWTDDPPPGYCISQAPSPLTFARALAPGPSESISARYCASNDTAGFIFIHYVPPPPECSFDLQGRAGEIHKSPFQVF